MTDVCPLDDDCIRGDGHDGECRYPTWMTPDEPKRVESPQPE